MRYRRISAGARWGSAPLPEASASRGCLRGDNPARFALLQQGQKFASQSDQGKHIGVEDALELTFRRCTCTQTYEAICRPYATVVDQDIQLAVARLDEF